MVRTLALGITTALALLGAATAHAQTGDQNRARQLFEAGVQAMDGGDPARATQYFSDSYQTYARASTACNLALSLERTNRSCEAAPWYRQCARLDQDGRFRDHADRQAAAIEAQCARTDSPFVGGPQPVPGGAGVQVVEGGAPPPYIRRRVSHALLAVGIVALVLGGGAIGGGAGAASEASAQAATLPRPAPGTVLTLAPGSAEAETYYSAQTLSNVAIGLYIGGSIVSALGAILVIADLAQPGVFDAGAAGSPTGPRLTLAPLPEGGGYGQLSLRF